MWSVRFYLCNILLAFAILIITKLWPESHLLAKASIENGPYEVATALILMLGAVALSWQLIRRSHTDWRMRAALVAMAAICFLGAGEEISWGQHWLKFQTSEFFTTHNHQRETNLHNLIPAVVFSTAINVVIYSVFTLFPVIHWAFPKNPLSNKISRWGFSPWIPNLDIGLMMLLASCFHAWLIPATYSDTAVLIFCWLIAAGLMIGRGRSANTLQITREQWLMLGLTVVGFALCVWLADIFRYHNMQYEIRECFTAYIIVIWALSWNRQAILQGGV